MYPVTTGGRISGMSTRPLSREWPQKRPRASGIAMAMPSGRLTRVATMETLRLSWTAVHSSGLSVIQSMDTHTSSATGRRGDDRSLSRASGAKNPQPLRLERGRGLVRSDVGEKSSRVRMRGVRRECDGIDDRRMCVLRERADDLDAAVGCGVGLVDDAGGCLAPRNEQQCGAHVFGLRELARDAGPDAELLKCRLPVLAGGHRVDIGYGQATLAENLGEIEPGFDLDRLCLVFGRNQNDTVAEQVRARFWFNQMFLCQIVHPVDIGGDEDLCWRSLFDLLGKRRAGCVGDRGLFARLLLPLRIDGIERVLETCCSENYDVSPLRLGWRLSQTPRQQ